MNKNPVGIDSLLHRVTHSVDYADKALTEFLDTAYKFEQIVSEEKHDES